MMNDDSKPAISENDIYQHLRDHIVHEDGLINNRLGWLLPAQALLFAAYGNVLKDPPPKQLEEFRHLQRVIPTVGILMSVFILMSIIGACWSMTRLRRFWKAWSGLQSEQHKKFPPLQAHNWPGQFGLAAPILVPLLFMGSWGWLLWPAHGSMFILLGIFLAVLILNLVGRGEDEQSWFHDASLQDIRLEDLRRRRKDRSREQTAPAADAEAKEQGSSGEV